MINISKNEFEKMVIQAIGSLPKEMRDKTENVEIVLEDEEEPDKNLLGLYQGVPRTKRGVYYSWVLPDKITIFKKTIERYSRDKQDLKKLIRHVVRHEIAHHFGYSDKDLLLL